MNAHPHDHEGQPGTVYVLHFEPAWSERTPIATIERTAALIDRLSRRIEDTVAGARSTRATERPEEGRVPSRALSKT
jgi:hypothetical protein